VAGTSLRLAEDGEVEAKGPQVFRGYWNNEEATREVLADDGWFNTGDVGRIEDGFLRIVGRKKELIVTAGGKNVAPEPMEDQLRAHSLISQAMVVGDNRRFIAAVVTIDEEAFDAWWPGDPNHEISVAEAVDHHDLLAEVQHAVDAVNAKVSRAESIRKFAILPKDLTVEDGEITPTLKVRRAIVAQHYEHVIDEMYAT
jgi:long-chain acyl-CoA synthetase